MEILVFCSEFGRLIQVGGPNGTRQRLQYDGSNRLTATFEERGAVSLWQSAYTFDDAHRITQFTATPAPRPFAPPPATMTYDVDNRLATYNGQSVPSDADGNLLAAPLNGTLLGNLTWDARNRLTAAGNTSYSYDAEGRRTTRTIGGNQTTTYTWSRGAALDRLLVTQNPDGSTTRYIQWGMGSNGEWGQCAFPFTSFLLQRPKLQEYAPWPPVSFFFSCLNSC